jgi:hypothetical protein
VNLTRWALGLLFPILPPVQRQRALSRHSTNTEYQMIFCLWPRLYSFSAPIFLRDSALKKPGCGCLREPWLMSSGESTRIQACGLSLASCPWVSHPTILGLGCFICKRRFGFSYLPALSSCTILWFKNAMFALTPVLKLFAQLSVIRGSRPLKTETKSSFGKQRVTQVQMNHYTLRNKL